eukprot:3612048-Pyramimonas_sp.AAC.1
MCVTKSNKILFPLPVFATLQVSRLVHPTSTCSERRTSFSDTDQLSPRVIHNGTSESTGAIKMRLAASST